MSTGRKNLRFLVAFIAAALAALICQVVVGLLSELLPLSDTYQDRASQIANSFIGTWVWIRVGAALSPDPHKVGAAILFGAIAMILSVGLLLVTLVGVRTGYSALWLLACTAAVFWGAVIAWRQADAVYPSGSVAAGA